MRRKDGKIDRLFLLVLLIIVGFGLLMVFSASMYSSTVNGDKGYSQFIRQAFFAVLGVGLMLLISRFNYRYLRAEKLNYIIIGLSIVLLMAVLIPGIGVEVNNARRWINVGITNFQPSEMAKIATILYISAMFSDHPELMTEPKPLWIRIFLPVGLIFGLTAIEPSLSAALAIAVGAFSALWFSGIPMKKLVPAFLLVGLASMILLVKESWRLQRLLALFGQSSVNYQIKQSLVAFGSGGIFGTGLGNGKQKLLFLPEIQNDFIFANIGEELGFVGCLFVLALYAILIWRGFQIAFACKDSFGRIYTAAVMTLLGFQVFVNIGVATQAILVTGMALPFISYGGTSIVMLLMMMGPILNISRNVTLPRLTGGQKGGKAK